MKAIRKEGKKKEKEGKKKDRKKLAKQQTLTQNTPLPNCIPIASENASFSSET